MNFKQQSKSQSPSPRGRVGEGLLKAGEGLWAGRLEGLLKLIRPKQWLKNVFVLIPMFFGGSMTDPANVRNSIVAFFAFSFVASSIYCFNDIIDVEADRRHPVKCHRPLASGALKISSAWFLMVLMVVLGLLLLPLITSEQALSAAVVIVSYYVLNLLYCSWLKQHAIVDVCVIAFGFVLRVLAGGFATDTVVSNWLVLMTFLLTLFLSFAKRRDDVLRMNETGEAPRKNTIRYNLTFINQAITITASVTLVCYIMYTVSPEVTRRLHSDMLYLTTAYVLLGLLRYIQLSVVDKRSGDPTKVLLRDRLTQVVVLLWALTFLVIIYIV